MLKTLMFFFSIVPIRCALALGYCGGLVAYLVSPRRSAIAYRNLRRALSDTIPPAALQKIVRRSFCHLGMNVAEILSVRRIDQRYVDRYITIHGLEHLQQARDRAAGTIILTAHYGNWELSSFIGGILGYDINAIARFQMGERINQLLSEYRQEKGARIIDKKGALRKMISIVRGGGIMGVLLDQNAGAGGIYADFFGRPASVRKEPLFIARKISCTVIPVFLERVKGPYHELFIYPPIDYSNAPSPAEAAERIIREFHFLLERHIHRSPSQWLWGHNRWKATPLRDVVILDDGKRGHSNQSQAVARIVTDVFTRLGKTVRQKTISIRFKGRVRRFVFAVLWRPFFCCCRLRFGLAQWALAPESFQAFVAAGADVVISAGSSLGPVNAFLAREHAARSIVCMRPQGIGLTHFSAVILPWHDTLKFSQLPDNIVVTNGSLHAITADSLQQAAHRLSRTFCLSSSGDVRRIGILIGGDTQRFSLTAQSVTHLFDSLFAVAPPAPCRFLVTTSRRTSSAIEDYLERHIARHPACELLIIAHKENPEDAVCGILGLSDVIVVTPDSISMISESASSGKPVIVYAPERFDNLPPKHRLVIDKYRKENIIKLCSASEITAAVRGVFEQRCSTRKLEDAGHVRLALEPILS